jgi:UDP:flavonoid glycosyltransferase YjiC (YdhE family)
MTACGIRDPVTVAGRPRRSARIVLTTWGSLGDLHPYLALAVELAKRGHVPVVATMPAWRPNVERAGVEFRPLRPDVSPEDPGAREIIRRVLDAKTGGDYLFRTILGPSVRETYEDTLAAVKADGPGDLLISHQIPLAAPIVAEMTRVKWVSALLAPAGFLSAYDPPSPPPAPGLRRLFALHPLLGRLFVGLGRHLSRSWVEPVYRLRESLGLPRGRNPVFEGQHSPTRVLGLFSRELASVQPDYPANTTITGFPFYDGLPHGKELDPGLARFLDGGDPPIVFTLGSSAVWIAEDFYAVSVAAVERLKRRAVLLVGENAASMRARLPERIGVFDYAPHALVMPKASVIVHQGGIGTTAQALRAGRPTLVVPFGQDQPDNARRCADLGVARWVPRSAYTVDRVTRELSVLLDNRDYARRAAEVARRVEAERGVDTAVDAIEALL